MDMRGSKRDRHYWTTTLFSQLTTHWKETIAPTESWALSNGPESFLMKIRNSFIKQFKAAASLESDSRWCLTGTPIQNTFDDLRSLLQFLRFEPFCQSKAFEEHIIKPFREDLGTGPDASRNLRIMLRTCCLRRTQAKLDLPNTTTEKISVAPTDDEKALFTRILEQCREEFDMMAGKDAGSRKPNVLFSTIMKLRRVCNHGIIAVESTSTKQPNQLAVPKKQRGGSRSPSSEPACEYCTDKDKEDEFLGVLDSCPLCGRLLSDGNDDTLSTAASPVSAASSTASMMDIDAPEVATNIHVRFPASKKLREQSSKMAAVINNIKESYIDGNSKRLTLTEANMVHIVEPQWNPTIEDQAIARVVRMGQTRPVTIFKYITAGSVEHTVVKLQERKTRMIKLSMQDKDDDDADTNLDNFKFAVDPNEWGAEV
ncbi:hypothetical protein ACHAP5_008319 [Fusarium lateritium]